MLNTECAQIGGILAQLVEVLLSHVSVIENENFAPQFDYTVKVSARFQIRQFAPRNKGDNEVKNVPRECGERQRLGQLECLNFLFDSLGISELGHFHSDVIWS